jgi:transcription initiation factor IIF auxiliary subunit
MFVRAKDASEALPIVSVKYHLHPTFSPSSVIKSKPPFALTRLGWGVFTITVELQFGAIFDNKSLQIPHDLMFQHGGSVAVYNINPELGFLKVNKQ